MLIYTELGAKENGIEEGNIIHLSYTYLYILFLKKHHDLYHLYF